MSYPKNQELTYSCCCIFFRFLSPSFFVSLSMKDANSRKLKSKKTPSLFDYTPRPRFFFYIAPFSRATTTTPLSRLPHRENTLVSPTLKSLALHSVAHPALNRVCRWPAEQRDSYVISHSRSCSSSTRILRRKMTVLGLRHVGAPVGALRAFLSSRGEDLPLAWSP